jgi:hypothetical protein
MLPLVEMKVSEAKPRRIKHSELAKANARLHFAEWRRVLDVAKAKNPEVKVGPYKPGS